MRAPRSATLARCARRAGARGNRRMRGRARSPRRSPAGRATLRRAPAGRRSAHRRRGGADADTRHRQVSTRVAELGDGVRERGGHGGRVHAVQHPPTASMPQGHGLDAMHMLLLWNWTSTCIPFGSSAPLRSTARSAEPLVRSATASRRSASTSAGPRRGWVFRWSSRSGRGVRLTEPGAMLATARDRDHVGPGCGERRPRGS